MGRYISRALFSALDRRAQELYVGKKFRPVAAGIARNEWGDVLIPITNKGRPTFLQGGIERGETVVHALRREFNEEARLSISEVLEFCLVVCLRNRKVPKNGFSMGAEYYYFHVGCYGNQGIVLKRNELCGCLWLPPRKALRFVEGHDSIRADKRESMLRALRIALHF